MLTGQLLADEDFPPLAPPSKPVEDKSSLGGLRTPSRRPGTPSVPPGLPLPHSHPVTRHESGSPLKTSEPKLTGTSQPPNPQVASNVASPAPNPREQNFSRQATPDFHDSPFSRSTRSVVPSESAAGSPKSTSVTQAGPPQTQPAAENSERVIGKDNRETRDKTQKTKPIKLTLSFPAYPPEHSPSRTPTPTHSAALPAPSSAVNSRPNTPATGVSRTSDPSHSQKQPRVLRVVDTPKSETPPLTGPPTQTGTSTPITKQKARKPSISSISRPDTPADLASEYDPFTSASASRANSPPPNRVGSAPVRTMTKSQLKKERKLKAKKEEALSASAVVEEPIQAPIIGRKRKTKKPSTRTSEQSTPTESKVEQYPTKTVNAADEKSQNDPDTPRRENSVDSSTEGEKLSGSKPAKETKVEPWHSNNTMEQLMNDANATGASIKDLFLERTAPLHGLLAHLHQSEVLDLSIHPLFNPPNITQRIDMRCTAEDYEMVKNPIELTEEHKKQLIRGEPVRINGDSDLIKNRCLITPMGCILRHLTPEEEDRYLQLEKSLSTALDSLQEYPSLGNTEPDVTNRGGGLDTLFATPDKFNIHWVDEDSQSSPISHHSEAILPPPPVSGAPNVFSSLDSDTARVGGSNTHAMMSAARSSLLSKIPLNGSGAAGIMGNAAADIEELMNMSNNELHVMISSAQRELELSRKEADAIDKKVTGLVKRNRKLAQLALNEVGISTKSPLSS